MNRFNLTFRGEIIDGHDREQAREHLATEYCADDPERLERGFSGEPVVLARGLERKQAAELYARLRRLGIQTELIKIGERGDLHAGESIVPRKEVRIADLPTGKELGDEEAALLDAKEKALQEALRAKAEEQARRQRAGERAKKKKLAREARERIRLEAIRKRSEEERQRQAEEEAARQAAELAEQQRQRELEQARLEAERQEQARRAAERAERQRQQELERARLAAEREEQARQAAELAERQRREALEQARLEAQRLEQARREEKQRKAAEKAAAKAAQREREKRAAEEKAARLAMEKARRKREQAEEIARRKAEEARHRAQLQAEAEEQEVQRRAMEEQAIHRAAAALAQKPELGPVDARVRTKLETPSRKRLGAGPGGERRRRQPGAPNLYSLTPFRNSPEIRARAADSQRAMRRGFVLAAGAALAAMAVTVRLLTLSPSAVTGGASAVAITPGQQPVLLADGHLLLHDRAGVGSGDLSFEALGVEALAPPLAFDSAGDLLAAGRLAGGTGAPELLRCQLEPPGCAVYPGLPADTTVSALAVHPLDDSLFIADAPAAALLRLGGEGNGSERADLELPVRPVLRLDSGLLLINRPGAPAIGVFRYEQGAFGRQLDEVLLLPPGRNLDEFSGVRDFLRLDDNWWVLLSRADGGTELHRFDSSWRYVDHPPLAAGSRARGLVAWGKRVLVSDPSRIPLQKFNSAGEPEAALVSSGLTTLIEGRQHHDNLVQLCWRLTLALSVLAAITGACLGSLHRMRSLVYTSCRERGADPLDEIADSIDWLDIAPERDARLRRTGTAWGVLAFALVLGAIGFGASALQLAALLLAVTGPALAWLLLQRSDPGHIGIAGRQLLLVDHRGMYHLGAGSRIHYRGPFLMIDDVAVFTGMPLLPAFNPGQIHERVVPLAAGAVRVDRKIATVKLLQGRHPLALGAIAILAGAACALALLSLHGIF